MNLSVCHVRAAGVETINLCEVHMCVCFYICKKKCIKFAWCFNLSEKISPFGRNYRFSHMKLVNMFLLVTLVRMFPLHQKPKKVP